MSTSCPIRNSLVSELQQIHARIMQCDNQEVETLLRSGQIAALEPLEQELKELRAERQRIIEAIRQHSNQHGC